MGSPNNYQYGIQLDHIDEPAAVIAPDCTYLHANEAFLRFFRLTHDELSKRKLSEIFEKEVFEQQIRSKFKHSLKGQTTKCASHYQHHTGKVVFLEYIFYPHYNPKGSIDKSILMIRDITEVKEMEQEVYESHRKLYTLMQHLPGMAYRCNNQKGWPMDFISEGCIGLTGYWPEEITTGPVMYGDLIHPEDRNDVWKEVQQAVGKNTSFQLIYRIFTKNQQEKWVWERGVMVPSSNDEHTHLEGLITDITERKKIEEELTVKNQEIKAAEEEVRASNEELMMINHRLEKQKIELRKAKKKAEESDRLKSRFLANMSHEIRTPMNGIMGFADILQKKQYPPQKQQKFLNIIHSSTRELLHIINDIVDVSKIEANQLSLNPRPFCLNDMLDELCLTYQAKMEHDNKQHLLLELEKGLSREDSWIVCDINRLKQVFNNLIGNAIKFTEQGGIYLSYRLKDTRTLMFSVRDTGIGIPEEKINKVFNRFLQLEESIHPQYGGTGLGLTISKNLIEMMGGQIGVESIYGKGSEFHFTLPCDHQQQSDVHQG